MVEGGRPIKCSWKFISIATRLGPVCSCACFRKMFAPNMKVVKRIPVAACRPRRQPMDLRQHDLWQQSYNNLFQEFSVNDFLEQYPNPSTSVASNFQLIKCPGQLSSSLVENHCLLIHHGLARRNMSDGTRTPDPKLNPGDPTGALLQPLREGFKNPSH